MNAFPYLGKDEQKPNGQRVAGYVVLRLMEPFLGKGRNITCDNYFTSVCLAKCLKEKSTNFVGTFNK